MRDYVIKIIDIPLFRIALQAEIDNGLGYAYIDDNNEAKLALGITKTIPRVGNATASISRLSDDEYTWLMTLPQVQDLGRGSPYIKEITDITWESGGEGFYHAIHLQTPYNVDDGEGGTVTITPPVLHSVIAS